MIALKINTNGNNSRLLFTDFDSLRRYDTIKLVDEISLNFPELFIIGKYEKIGLKTGDHHPVFSVLEVKTSKILQKLNKRD